MFAGTDARSRRLLGLVLLVALVLAAALASIAVGTRSIGLGQVWHALVDGGLRSEEAVIVHRLRVPRTLLGVLVGVALGVSGALMQGHTRNPLADPGLLGVTAGASFAVVLAIVRASSPARSVTSGSRCRGGDRHGRGVRRRLGRRFGATPLSLLLAGAVTALLL